MNVRMVLFIKRIIFKGNSQFHASLTKKDFDFANVFL